MLIHTFLACSILAAITSAQCPPLHSGPDVTAGEITSIHYWGSVGGIGGYSLGVTACNIGNANLPWSGTTDMHPVLSQSMYRLRDGRMQQIGTSFVSHGHSAIGQQLCCPCTQSGSLDLLGVGCSNSSTSSLNGDQAGSGLVGGLGPRSDINASTGAFPFPYTSQGVGGNAIYKRLQVANADLDPFLNAGARYFVEALFVAPGDVALFNNASYREAFVTTAAGGGFNMTVAGSVTERERALQAWQGVDPSVTLFGLGLIFEGNYYLGSLCTDLGGGMWHYEYALFNENSHRSVRAFRVPLPPGTSLTNIEFVDVDYHSGEPYDGTDWAVALTVTEIEWSTETEAVNPNANALRWGTTYNFAFDANVGPGDGEVDIGLFRAGTFDGFDIPCSVPEAPPCVAQNYCSTSPNSNGAGAILSATGSTSISANDFVLHASDASVNQPGLFFYGPGQIQVAFGNGFRCVGAGGTGISRLNPPVTTDAAGDRSRALNYTLPPMDSGPGMITAGTSMNIQFWFRDPAGGGAGFNLSDGLRVTFCP